MGKNEVEYTDPDTENIRAIKSVIKTLEETPHATKDTNAEDQPKEASNEISNPTPPTQERKAKRRNAKKR